jgi:hypothetical protein
MAYISLKSITLSALTGVLLMAATGNRPLTPNDLSPSAETSIRLGGHPVTVEYSAPSARGRQVEGGLIPYGIWYRLGADSATTLTSDTDIKIGDLKVPRGVHTLFLYAKKGDWKLIVNKQTRQWGLDYDPKQDLGRVPLTLTKLSAPLEKFRITLKTTGPNTGLLTIEWNLTKAEVPVSL